MIKLGEEINWPSLMLSVLIGAIPHWVATTHAFWFHAVAIMDWVGYTSLWLIANLAFGFLVGVINGIPAFYLLFFKHRVFHWITVLIALVSVFSFFNLPDGELKAMLFFCAPI